MQEIKKYGILLKSDGTCWSRRWVYDDEARKGEYKMTQVTGNWLSVVGDLVKIEPGFRFRDLCALLSNEKEFLDLHFRNCFLEPYLKEFDRLMADGVQGKPYEYDPDGIEFLSLTWLPEVDEDTNEVWGMDRPDLDGVGWELREDKMEENDLVWKKGSRIPWGLDFTPMEDLLNLPIVSNDDFVLSKRLRQENYREEILFCGTKRMTFGDIVEGIFWEISFHGGPQDKQEARDDLRKLCEEVVEMRDAQKKDTL